VEVALAADHARGEAAAEEMPGAVVPAVEPLRMEEEQTVHSLRQVDRIALDDEVQVVVEQAPGVNVPAVATDHVPEDTDECSAIVIVDDDRAAVDPASDHVEAAMAEREVTSRDTRHEGSVGARPAAR